MNYIAVIFDMDGVIIDSNPHHEKSWKKFSDKYDFQISDRELKENVYGRIGKDAFNYFFKRELSTEELKQYVGEKEGIFREMYKPHIKPLNGLMEFLDSLKAHDTKLAIATSAPQSNLKFMLENIPIRHYFDAFLDESYVKKGKPDPEIYLKAAKALETPPERCVVIEDSIAGVKSGLNAGMKVIGVTTTHSEEELNHTDMVINDFEGMDYERVKGLVV